MMLFVFSNPDIIYLFFNVVEEHFILSGSIISRLDNGAFVR